MCVDVAGGRRGQFQCTQQRKILGRNMKFTGNSGVHAQLAWRAGKRHGQCINHRAGKGHGQSLQLSTCVYVGQRLHLHKSMNAVTMPSSGQTWAREFTPQSISFTCTRRLTRRVHCNVSSRSNDHTQWTSIRPFLNKICPKVFTALSNILSVYVYIVCRFLTRM